MDPLLLVNWHALNARFRALMWAIAAILALAIVLKGAPRPKPAQHRPHVVVAVGGLQSRP
jgi:hypothetical protein